MEMHPIFSAHFKRVQKSTASRILPSSDERKNGSSFFYLLTNKPTNKKPVTTGIFHLFQYQNISNGVIHKEQDKFEAFPVKTGTF